MIAAVDKSKYYRSGFLKMPALLASYRISGRLPSNFYLVIGISPASLIVQVIETGKESLATPQGCSREAAALFVDEIIQIVGLRREDRIFLVGSQQIELLIELAHHGFTDVTCGAALVGPNAGEFAADIFVVPAVQDVPQFAALTARLSRHLRPHGVLLLGADGALIATRLRTMQQVVRQSGFVFVHRRIGTADMDFYHCRRLRAQQLQAA